MSGGAAPAGSSSCRPSATARASTVASVAVVFSALAAVGSPALAQRVVPTLEIGASRVQYADSVTSSAATISPSIRVDYDRATIGAAGGLAQFADGWSAQGALHASLYSPPRGPFVGELGLTTGGSTHSDGTRTAQTLAVARAHVMRREAGAWAGIGGGSAWDGQWRPVVIGEIGGWLRLRDEWLALATVTPTQVTDSIRYTDSELALRWTLPNAELGASGGARSGSRAGALGGDARGWGSVSATMWVAPRIALTGSGGSYPVDLTQGFPGGRFFSLGIVIGPRASRPTGRAQAPLAGDDVAPSPADGVSDLRVRSVGTQRTLLVRAPAARRVEIAGDFTHWDAVALAQGSGGWWSVTLPIPDGTHQVNVRVDGGKWLVPPGLPPLKDEFGGSVGLLVFE